MEFKHVIGGAMGLTVVGAIVMYHKDKEFKKLCKFCVRGDVTISEKKNAVAAYAESKANKLDKKEEVKDEKAAE